MDNDTHKQWVTAAQAGDRDAFGRLVREHQGLVFGICYRLTHHVHDAEDLAHEAFIEAFVKLGTLREPAKFAPWLKTLTLNLCRMWYRRHQCELIEYWDELPPTPVGAPGADDTPERLPWALLRLSPAHRLAVVLHYYEGLSYEEVSTFLDVPIGTVMSRLSRARDHLRKVLKETRDQESIPMIDDREFHRELDAEIDVLLAMFHDEPTATERLSVILSQSPARLEALVGDVRDDRVLHDLALLLPRLGRVAMGVVLGVAFDGAVQARRNAVVLLERFIARCTTECRGIGTGTGKDLAALDAYVFSDVLLQRDEQHPPSTAPLLLELLASCEDIATGELLSQVLLSVGEDAAYPLLLERFWRSEDVTSVYRKGNWVSHSLRCCGARFCQDLIDVLRAAPGERAPLALAGLDMTVHGCHWRQIKGRKCAPAPRWLWTTDDADVLGLVELGDDVLSAAAATAARCLDAGAADERNTAIRVLQRVRSPAYADQVRSCLDHDDLETRVRSIHALAALRDTVCADVLRKRAASAEPVERRAAVEALGRIGVHDAQPLLLDLVRDEDADVRRAAAIALGELGTPEAREMLRELLASPEKTLRKAASSALYGRDRAEEERQTQAHVEPEYKQRLRELRGRSSTPHWISVSAAIDALPELRAYDDKEITQLISGVCGDWATTRRRLIELRLMRRPGGVYEFTELGAAVWRVEHFIMDHYLR